MWCPIFEFPLPVTSLAKKQCKTLQRVFTNPFLAKMRISRTTSQVLVFAPYYYSGFSIADTWVHQGLQHLHFLLGHLSYQDKVGNLLQININTLQLIIELPDPPLTYSLPHLGWPPHGNFSMIFKTHSSSTTHGTLLMTRKMTAIQ